MPKITLFHQFLLEIELIQEFYYLIRREHFRPYPIKNFQMTFYLRSIYLSTQKIVLIDAVGQSAPAELRILKSE